MRPVLRCFCTVQELAELVDLREEAIIDSVGVITKYPQRANKDIQTAPAGLGWEAGSVDLLLGDPVAKAAGRSAPLLQASGLALAAAGALMALATLLHPSHETATTIIASEVRLIAAHFAYTLSWLLVLLGLPGLYAAQRDRMGRLGLLGFLTAFAGTYLIAVTGNFGFLAPVLAKNSPAVLDVLNQYPPVVVINGLAAIAFMIGYVVFGIAMTRAAPWLPRLAGILVAVGAPVHLLGFGLAQLVSPALWPIAVLGSISLGAGLAWLGYRLWHAPTASQPSPLSKTVRP
jgi:hypothetical protein